MQTLSRKYTYIIGPGYVAFNDQPALLSSVCGSGIVVTLWDRARKNGGIAHCIFPGRRWREKPTNYHADVAIPSLINQFLDYDSDLINLEAQLFGAGTLLESSKKESSRLIKAARKILRKFDIPVVSEDVGGSSGRKIIFDTSTGDSLVLKTKRIRREDWVPANGLMLDRF